MPAAPTSSLEAAYQSLFDRIRADLPPHLKELLFDLDEVVGSRLLEASEAGLARH